MISSNHYFKSSWNQKIEKIGPIHFHAKFRKHVIIGKVLISMIFLSIIFTDNKQTDSETNSILLEKEIRYKRSNYHFGPYLQPLSNFHLNLQFLAQIHLL